MAVLFDGLAGLPVLRTQNLQLAKALLHSLQERLVEVVMALAHILQVRVLV